MKIQNHNNKPQSLTSCLAAIRRRQEKQKNGVILMTMHGSKGLEFDRVWIARAAMGITPHRMGLIDEERRLFYVAATRAKDYGVLSCGAPDMPSIFWQEGNLSLSDDALRS
jgi:superfamily I DNA/RNA helicase